MTHERDTVRDKRHDQKLTLYPFYIKDVGTTNVNWLPLSGVYLFNSLFFFYRPSLLPVLLSSTLSFPGWPRVPSAFQNTLNVNSVNNSPLSLLLVGSRFRPPPRVRSSQTFRPFFLVHFLPLPWPYDLKYSPELCLTGLICDKDPYKNSNKVLL